MLLVGEIASTSQECLSGSDIGQETTIAKSVAGCTVSIKLINKRDESAGAKKTDDESGQEKEIDVEEQGKIDVEEQGKMTIEQEGESTNDDESEDEPSIVEFEDPVYELSQMYKMESEYENMTIEHEATEVRALTPAGQAKYRELTRLHQQQAEIEKRMMGVSELIEERTKARTPGLPIDLIKRSVQVEPTEKQELHHMTEKQRVQTHIKQDEIPRTDRPRTGKGYYLFVEDDAGCMVEQWSGQVIRDTDTEQHLPTDLITEVEAATYQVPGQDSPTIDHDAETINLTSTADYDHEEVETSLTTISEAFHTIAQEYEKLMGTIPHMSKIQATQVMARLPILPIQKQEMKREKTEATNVVEAEPMPGTSAEQPAAAAEKPVEEPMEEVMMEPTTEEKDDEPKEENVNEYFRKYILTGKGKGPEEKIQEACKKEINYRNLVVLIAVRDYIVNQTKNIKEVAKKWGLSFSAVQWAMSRKQEHSVGGRQYAKRKKAAEKQEGPAKKSKWVEEKRTAEPAEVRSPQPAEPSQDSLDSTELPDLPWVHA